MEDYLKLVKAARRGDAQAFAALYEEVYEDMYRFALYTLKNIQDAEDVVSETVTAAFASIKKLRSAVAFHSWIFRILSNKCKGGRLPEDSRSELLIQVVYSKCEAKSRTLPNPLDKPSIGRYTIN